MEFLLAFLFLISFALFFWKGVQVVKERKASRKKDLIIQALGTDLKRYEELAYGYEMKAAQLQGEISQFCKESRAARRFWKKIARRKIRNK